MPFSVTLPDATPSASPQAGADFSFEVEVGSENLTKQPSLIEDIAYRDTWGRGKNSFAAMIYERLKILKDRVPPSGVGSDGSGTDRTRAFKLAL
jgi:hypothetical protein